MMKKITRDVVLDAAQKILEKAEAERMISADNEAEKGIQILDCLWLVGQSYMDYHPQAWEFVGVFSTKEKAIEACKTWRYFVTSICLDVAGPEATTLFNCFYPKGNGFPE